MSEAATFKIACPTCRKTIRLPVSRSGQKISCPGCTQRIQIPDLRPTGKTVLAPIVERPSKPPKAPQPPKPQQPRPEAGAEPFLETLEPAVQFEPVAAPAPKQETLAAIPIELVELEPIPVYPIEARPAPRGRQDLLWILLGAIGVCLVAGIVLIIALLLQRAG